MSQLHTNNSKITASTKTSHSSFKITKNKFPYYTLAYLATSSPSIEVLSLQHELQYRQLLCTICLNIAKSMQYNTRVFTTATQCIQQYYLRRKVQLVDNTNNTLDNNILHNYISYNSYIIISSSLLLCSKTEDQPRKLHEFIQILMYKTLELYEHSTTFKHVIPFIKRCINNYNNELIQLRDDIVSYELLVYTTNDYDVQNIENIFEYTLSLFKHILGTKYDSVNKRNHDDIVDFTHTIYTLSYISLRSTLYTHYHIQGIAITILYICDTIHSSDIIDIQRLCFDNYIIDHEPWFELFGSNQQDIIDMYKMLVECISDQEGDIRNKLVDFEPKLVKSFDRYQRHAASPNKHNNTQHKSSQHQQYDKRNHHKPSASPQHQHHQRDYHYSQHDYRYNRYDDYSRDSQYSHSNYHHRDEYYRGNQYPHPATSRSTRHHDHGYYDSHRRSTIHPSVSPAPAPAPPPHHRHHTNRHYNSNIQSDNHYRPTSHSRK